MLSIFLRRGLLCCVYLQPIGKELSGENRYPPPEFQRAYCLKRPTGKELSGENRYPPPEFRRAYCSYLSGVLLLSVNNNIHCLQHIIHIVFYNIYSKILRCTKIYPIKELYTGNKLFYIMNSTKLTSQSLKFQRFFPLGCL